MKKVTYSAPGKIHFLGEHAVVHGKPALLAAINLRIKVSISTSPDHSEDHDDMESYNRIARVVESTVKKKFRLNKIPKYFISIDSKIPIGSGLGSSAAISSAYIAALLEFLKINFDTNLVNELTFECEKIFNGNPSGGDNTTVVYGGLIWYRKELDFLKTFQKLPFKVHKNIKQFFIIDSGKPVEGTAEMVGKVRIKWQASRFKVEKIFREQEQLVKDLTVALKEGNENKLIKIVKQGEKNLEKLGVVGKKAKGIIAKVERFGGSAKIIGGGGVKDGSGMLLAYHKNPKKLLELGKMLDWSIIPIKLGEEGLRKENGK